MDYEKLLKKGLKNLPETALTKAERFEIPKVKGHLEGNKTVISNFNQIVSTLARKKSHVLKFILKELATPGELKSGLLRIGAKIPASRINEKIKKYAVEYVICSECSKPDTKLKKERNVDFKKCMACGTKTAVR